jgi:hypothetical protein
MFLMNFLASPTNARNVRQIVPRPRSRNRIIEFVKPVTKRIEDEYEEEYEEEDIPAVFSFSSS